MVVITLAYVASNTLCAALGFLAGCVVDEARERWRRQRGLEEMSVFAHAKLEEASQTQHQGVDMAVTAGSTLRSDESARLQRLCEMQALGIESGRHLDDVTAVLGWLTNVPIVLVSLVTAQKLCFQSRFGLDARQVPREEHSLCSWCIKPENPEVFVVPDACEDERVQKSGIVCGPPFVRFYAGCPLQSSEGYPLGTLCLIDQTPRHMSPGVVQLLVNFAEIVTRSIEKYDVESSESSTTDVLDFSDVSLEADTMLSHSSSANRLLTPSDSLNSTPNFEGGVHRRERVEESLREAHILVAIDTTSLHWTILYGDATWARLTNISINPPTKATTDAEVDALIHFWQVATYLDESGLEESNGGAPRPDELYKQFAEDGATFRLNVLLPSVSLPGGCLEVSCRCVPADLPLDVNAAAIALRSIDMDGDEGFARLRPTQKLYFFCLQPVMETTGRNRKIRRFLKDRPHLHTSLLQDVKLKKVLGSGSFAKVYLGNWMGTMVAVKVLRRRPDKTVVGAGSESMYEASLSARLSHPHIVQTFEFSSQRVDQKLDDELITLLRLTGEERHADTVQLLEMVIVQEWCDVGTLRSFAAENNLCGDYGKRISSSAVIECAVDIASALEYMHDQSVVHGDLSSNNVLLTSRPNKRGFVLKVADFGLSRALEGSINTKSLGTVRYMPPEMVSTFEPSLTIKVDIYSCGVILWELCSGRVPWASLTPPQVVVKMMRGSKPQLPPVVPKGLVDLIEQCMSMQAEDRPCGRKLGHQAAKLLAEDTGSQKSDPVVGQKSISHLLKDQFAAVEEHKKEGEEEWVMGLQ